MKLSLVIPAYNEEAYIGKCLESIAAEQARGQFDMEIIVVNNASTDRTGDVARAFPFVRVVDEPRKGLVRARQTGYEASNGELIANVDADAIMPQGWIEQAFKEFALDPKLVALSGPYIYYDLSAVTNWLILFWYRLGKVVSMMSTLIGKSGSLLQGGNFILRRSALERAGGFDLNFDFYGEDTAIAKKMSGQGKVKFTFSLPIYTSGRRLKAEGIFSMAWKYGINFAWTILFNKAYTKEYKDVRL